MVLTLVAERGSLSLGKFENLRLVLSTQRKCIKVNSTNRECFSTGMGQLLNEGYLKHHLEAFL